MELLVESKEDMRGQNRNSKTFEIIIVISLAQYYLFQAKMHLN